MDNPKNFTGYGENVWGFTACDGPPPTGYNARGLNMNDDGTIAPTAAGGSIPFAPEISIPALRYMYDQYRTQIWTGYGFRDAFNLSKNWWGTDMIGIDEGPIVLMIENYRTGNVWKTFMKDQIVTDGLARIGFTNVTGVANERLQIPEQYGLTQNYPNPFNPVTTIQYSISHNEHGPDTKVLLQVYDVLGTEIQTIVNENQSPGIYTVQFSADRNASGVYFYRLTAGKFISTKKMIVLR